MQEIVDQAGSQLTPQDLKDIVVYIPAYNASKTLPKVLDRIPQLIRENCRCILIIDNCSTDETSKVGRDYQQRAGFEKVTVVRNEKNLGYGGSQKIAYRYCIQNNCRGVVMLHGDAQYAPEFAGYLIQSVVDGSADMVFGSRMAGNPLKGGMPLHRFLGNRALTIFQNILLGTKISEFHSGYRVFSVKALNQVPFENLSTDYHFDTEILILFVEHGLRIAEKPIPTHYGDEECYVNIWQYGMNVLVTTVTYFCHKNRLRHSNRWAARLGQST